MILNIGGGGGLPIRLIVTAPTGSAVSVAQGTTVLAANEVDGVWTFAIPSLGVWTIHATIEGQSLTQDVDISKVGQYNVTLEKPVKTTLNDNDWATIKIVADESKGANYWAVGDTKEIVIDGKLSDGLTLSNYQTWVYIIGFDHNKDVEGTGIAFQGFKTAQSSGIDVALCDNGYNLIKTSGQWFNMNNSDSNAGGWNSSSMRSTTLPLVKYALPSDLQAALKTTSIYSDNTGGGNDVASYVTTTQDDLYLLAEFEIFGARRFANTAEQNYQKQYAYYAAGNSKIKYKHNSTATATGWWERSVESADSSGFCLVGTSGAAEKTGAYYSRGLAPAFKVGGAKYTPLEYIASSGTQYIDTGISVTPENYQQLKMSVTCEKIGQGSGASNWLVDGSNVANAYFYMGIYNGKYYYGCGTTDHDTGITATSGKQTFTLDIPSSKFTVSDAVDVSISTEAVTASASLYLFGFNYNPVRCYAEKVYSCQIYMGDTLVRDFIPAKDELGNLGLYDKVEGKFYYNAGTGVFNGPGIRAIGTIDVEQSVYCNVNNVKTEFIVVNQGKPSSLYDDSCDGTWLLKRSDYGSRYFSDASDNVYETSYIHSYLNNTFLNQLDIKDIVKQVKIPYRSGGGVHGTDQSGANGLSTKVFLLSGYEVGWTTSDSSNFPVDGAKLSYFASGTGTYANKMRIMYSGLIASDWWTRSPQITNSFIMWIVNEDGSYYRGEYDQSLSVRPAFIIPSDTYIDEDNNILTAPPYNTISTLNVGDSVFFNVGGVKTEYIIVHKGNPDETIYDASCDGVWAVCKNIPNNSLAWRSMPYVIYSNSLAKSWPNTTYYNTIDSGIKQYIKTAKLPYTTYSGGNFVSYNMANGMEQNCFLLSWVELGGSVAYPNTNRSSDGAALSYFSGQPDSIRIAKYGNNATDYWTRSVWKSGEDMALAVSYSGDGSNPTCTTQIGMRPALIFDNNTPIDSSNNIIA